VVSDFRGQRKVQDSLDLETLQSMGARAEATQTTPPATGAARWKTVKKALSIHDKT
jgi:hypothetical protein